MNIKLLYKIKSISLNYSLFLITFKKNYKKKSFFYNFFIKQPFKSFLNIIILILLNSNTSINLFILYPISYYLTYFILLI